MLPEKNPPKIVRTYTNLKHLAWFYLVSLWELIKSRPESICPRFLIWRDIKIEKTLGATGIWDVDGDNEIPSINPKLFEFLQWLNENKNNMKKIGVTYKTS